MTRYLLLILFATNLGAPVLGWDLSLAPGLSVKNAFLYLMVTSLLLETAIARHRKLQLIDVIGPYALLVCYAFLTWLLIVLVVKYPGYHAIASFVLLKSNFADHLLIFLVCFYGVTTAKDAGELLRWMVATVMIANLITVMDSLNLPHLGLIEPDEDGRIGGPMGTPNEYGGLLAFYLPATFAYLSASHGRSRIFAIVGLLASILALLLTASRGALVGVICGSVAGAVLLRRRLSGRTLVRGMVALGALCVVAVVIVFGTDYGSVLSERLIQSGGGSAVYVSSGRTAIWSQALGKMLDYPSTFVTGFGWHAYESFGEFQYATHNFYLNLLFNLGVIGLTLFLLTVRSAVSRSIAAVDRADSEARAYIVATVFGLLSLLIAVIFSDLSLAWFFIWAFCGVALRLSVEVNASAKSIAPSLTPEVPAPAARGT